MTKQQFINEQIARFGGKLSDIEGVIFIESADDKWKFKDVLSNTLSACWDKSRQEALEELERKLPDKLTFAKGVMKMIFGDGRQDEIPVASNYDSGRTSYRNEIKELIKSMKI